MLDFIVDTFVDAKTAVSPVPPVSELIEKTLGESPHEQELIDRGEFPYTLLLWNDEQHSFNEVISQVDEAISCGRARAKAVAEFVDEHV